MKKRKVGPMLLRRQEGQAVSEYALLALLITTTVISIAPPMTRALDILFTTVEININSIGVDTLGGEGE